MTMTLAADLQERWRPSEQQIAEAQAALDAGAEVVYTAHVLIGKQYGWWTEDVEILHIDGVFTGEDEWKAREAATGAAFQKAQALYRVSNTNMVGGYARHTMHEGQQHWAVWDDIISEFTKVAR